MFLAGNVSVGVIGDLRDIHGVVIRFPTVEFDTAVETLGSVIAWFVWGEQESGASHLHRPE